MEIVKFEPDLAAIEKRKNIRPYGDISNIKVLKHSVAPKFTKYTTEVEISQNTEEKIFTAYVPSFTMPKQVQSNTYVPPIKAYNPVSIKLSNIPLDILKPDLGRAIKSKTSVHIINLNMVMDRETQKFRGFVFLQVDSKDSANKFLKEIRGLVIDSYVVAAELARPM